MPPDTEKYSYQLFNSTNVCSINSLHSLLSQHTAGSTSTLSVINPYIEVLAHTYVLDIMYLPTYYQVLLMFTIKWLTLSDVCCNIPLLLPFIQFLGSPRLWSTGDYSHASQISTDLLQQ